MLRPVTEPSRLATGATLAIHRWQPATPRALCIIVHGYAEHALRYEPLAAALVARGVAVWAPDLRGHGRSPGVRGDVPSFEAVAADVASLVDEAQQNQPNGPIVLFGHSFGGAVALQVALDRPEGLSGLVLSAPFLRPTAPPSAATLSIATLLARLWPTLPVQPLDAELVSRDPVMVAAYRNDPLVYHGRVRARMGAVMVQAGKRLLEVAGGLRVPTVLFHGAADGLADVNASLELAALVGAETMELDIIEGGYHELLNDIGRDSLLQTIIDRIDGFTTPPAPAS